MKKTTSNWANDSIFYHIYPLGLLGAPQKNDFSSPTTHRLEVLNDWLSHIEGLGCNALYLGPIFESSSHGYDTKDYYQVDRRLGNNDTFRQFAFNAQSKGIRLVLDAVFNHVGRDFWAFQDLQIHGPASRYRNWFSGLDFTKSSPLGDAFDYHSWRGHYELVKLNLKNPEVKAHLFGAVKLWVGEFDIAGLRMDAADVMDIQFLRELAAFCKSLRRDFWLVGEVIHGNYNLWGNAVTLDSITNYECYKGLYSSLNDINYFEIAYALDRQYGPKGLYKNLSLYAFVDNHDVDRVASLLEDHSHLYPLYALLYTMPGVPSIYYGSEWGLLGKRLPTDDSPLRPALDLNHVSDEAPQPDLPLAIAQLALARQAAHPLRYGDYRQLHVSHQQLAFARRSSEGYTVVALNASQKPTTLKLPVAVPEGTEMNCLLGDGQRCVVQKGHINVAIPPNWVTILT